ncbi:Fatty acid synthase, partial [Gryllus bimaculatus]
MISPLLRWNHDKDWPVEYTTQLTRNRVRDFVIDDADWAFFYDHLIDDRPIIPAVGYMYMAWMTFAESMGQICSDTPVLFEKVKLLRATHLPKKGNSVTLRVSVNLRGEFEVSERSTAVVEGRIRLLTAMERARVAKCTRGLRAPTPASPSASGSVPAELLLTEREVDKVLRLRGYHQRGLFRTISDVATDGLRGHVRWDDNWITFLDNLVQYSLLQFNETYLEAPTVLVNIAIDPILHKTLLDEGNGENVFVVETHREAGSLYCGGVELVRGRSNIIARRPPAGKLVLERYAFEADGPVEEGEEGEEVSEALAVRLGAQLALENRPPPSRGAQPLPSSVKLVLGPGAVVPPDSDAETWPQLDGPGFLAERNCAFVVGRDLLAAQSPWSSEALAQALAPGGCVLSVERATPAALDETLRHGLRLVFSRRLADGHFVVLR